MITVIIISVVSIVLTFAVSKYSYYKGIVKGRCQVIEEDLIRSNYLKDRIVIS